MSGQGSGVTLRSTFFLLLRFVLIVPFITMGWWLVLPYYSHVLLQSAGSLLRFVLQVPIESGSIIVDGIFNTGSQLIFKISGEIVLMDLALLTTNLAPYVALVLATGQIKTKRRMGILGLGSGIIVATHILSTTLFFYLIYSHIDDTAYLEAGTPPFYITLTQFMLTLPFLLWIIFAIWPQLAKTLQGGDPT